MEQITLRLPSDVISECESEAEDADESRSEYLREVIKSRHDDAEEVDNLREEVNRLRTEVERLQNEKRQLIEQREEHEELVKWADRERTLQEEKLRAGIGRRLKWWVWGKDEP